MNIVLGVDKEERAGAPSFAASLLRRLRFPKAEIDVVHILTPTRYDDWGLEGEAVEAADRALRERAHALVNQTAAQFREGASIRPESASARTAVPLVRALVQDATSVADGLLGYADQREADLIAVDGPHSGAIRAFLTGSVARSLVIGSHNRSLLLAKDPQPARNTVRDLRIPAPKDKVVSDDDLGAFCEWPAPSGPLRVVFATDHSPYANRCLKQLFHLAPQGISHFTVMTAYPEDELTDIGRFLPHLALHPATAVRELLMAQNDEVLQKLAPLLEAEGATSESRVIGAAVHDAIAQTMEETQADLLILGARGHGFVDRLSPGSVSFHQAMTAPHSILLLRA